MAKSDTVYCTYFDKGFLLKGLALHSSLIRYNPNAKLWIIAFDEYTETILKKLNLRGVTIVPLSKFENRKLLSVKKLRSRVEYMWTTTPFIPLYVFKNSNADYVMYLDADEYFFSSPDVIVNEIGTSSLLAVEHRFPKGREVLNHDLGRFNVAVNLFKRDNVSMNCLKRWAEQCIDWCYWKHEEGKMGDQMYLNEWPDLYGTNLVVSKNLGVNVAPWNITQYEVTKNNGLVYVDGDRLVCYHFHQFQIIDSDKFSRVHGYVLGKNILDNIYVPYEDELRKQYKIVESADPAFEIKVPDQKRSQILRQKLAKYLGPPYWRVKTLMYNMKPSPK